MSAPPPAAPAIAAPLLDWYDRHARRLPWRAPPGVAPEPYVVWLSEIMLQQTTVAAVIPYFLRFLARWPDVNALAAAEEREVMQAWAGLGYYSRARNLHACAREIAGRGGVFPASEAGLRALPGIGAYTSAAIAAIAFGQPAVVVDGNVERVVARLLAITEPLPAAKPALRQGAALMTPAQRPGDYAQAMMDLGATICTPRAPACVLCPLAADCRARALGIAAALPARLPRRERPARFGIALVVTGADGRLLVRSRPARGLLAGMSEVPGSAWLPAAAEAEATLPRLPLVFRPAGSIEHVFTHFSLRLEVRCAQAPHAFAEPEGCRWVAPLALAEEAWPTVMLKVLAAAGVKLPQAARPARARLRSTSMG